MDQMISAPQSAPVDVTMDNFMAEVIEGSKTTPTIVQFWAPWCGPCKQLGPVLEKVVGASGGKVRMVRVNIDDNQQIAQQMRVQSVPTVYGFVDGQPVDGFAGAQPESNVKQFVEKLSSMGGAGADVASMLEAAEAALASGDHGTAMMQFQEVMSAAPESVAALAGVVRCLSASGDNAGAREVIDQLNDEYREDPAMQSAIAAVELAEKASESAGELDAAKAAVEADPNDLAARQEYALALYAVGANAEAMAQLLESIRIERGWNDDAARLQLLEFFATLGAANPDVIAARRKLSTLLFS
ncbi:MAG TPA: co-chaperone YbbN [Alphaproteobacteria bacterium]|jgi:putative thioredoxin|nr:co-chaperone YbbN [SAR116 cluster bacterium]MEC7372540.1 co-chaperone YbbN [Pseudomonadota bacterium]MEE3091654.1 co-chaperone YbbN [Pseudomonadota bacterium]HAG23792.1 co-chaperone YbbN [Alphaproteobacteria bacterium]|tara:strand:+ start:145 stop:1044 length:900 start_codon:yes stop_codon:yes gene_type:complete